MHRNPLRVAVHSPQSLSHWKARDGDRDFSRSKCEKTPVIFYIKFVTLSILLSRRLY
jgi:hypothetical protein